MPVETDRYRLALYFADSISNLYQIRQWYRPLERASRTIPTVVIARNARAAITIESETELPVYYARTIGEVESFIQTQHLSQVHYVNQNIRNFQMLRFHGISHVFVSHGESEKSYMWSNQLRAYDYAFVAGDAAVNRLREHLVSYDPVARTRSIGRPQIDVTHEPPIVPNPAYKTVLYAPTWEGDRPSMTYGSVLSHGQAVIEDLLESGRFNIVFRPHPRSGLNDKSYGRAVRDIEKLLRRRRVQNGPTYYVDHDIDWGWQWSSADICIADISAVAYDWLATSKPLIVTEPASREVDLSEAQTLANMPLLSAFDSSNIVSRLDRLLTEESSVDYKTMVNYHFGDVSRGASMQRYIDAIIDLDRRNMPLPEPEQDQSHLVVVDPSEN